MKNIIMMEVDEWDDLVEKTYNRPYSFQQQDGCKDRGTHEFEVPSKYTNDYPNDSLPEKINGNEMGVSFKAWLAADPNKLIAGKTDTWYIRLWWERNFYPSQKVLANDLYEKGLLKPGNYIIRIDW